MKKMLLPFLVVFSLFFSSCGFNANENKGSLVIQNNAENENISITAVYVKEKESSGYQLVWSGEIKNNESEFILLEKGDYSVKIATVNSLYDLFSSINYYETGYNIYKTLNAYDFVNVVFDGNGIYFE